MKQEYYIDVSMTSVAKRTNRIGHKTTFFIHQSPHFQTLCKDIYIVTSCHPQ